MKVVVVVVKVVVVVISACIFNHTLFFCGYTVLDPSFRIPSMALPSPPRCFLLWRRCPKHRYAAHCWLALVWKGQPTVWKLCWVFTYQQRHVWDASANISLQNDKGGRQSTSQDDGWYVQGSLYPWWVPPRLRTFMSRAWLISPHNRKYNILTIHRENTIKLTFLFFQMVHILYLL